jgi:hypothetical protein
MNVVVLGCGPAGLMAAMGAADAGADRVQIISNKRKSEMYGAQYLHEPIPGIPTGNPVLVRYNLNGEADDYREKVYGRNWDGSVSPEDLAEDHNAWDIRLAYDRLWEYWKNYIQHRLDVTPAHVAALIVDHNVDLVINSIPRPIICSEGHSFGAQQIWAAGDAPARGIEIPYQCPPNTVLCDGTDSRSWYRLSRIYDHTTVEWSLHSMPNQPPIGQPALVNKPTRHNCTCWPGVKHVGRYGRWEKGVLSHTAYHDAHSLVHKAIHDGVQPELPWTVQ